MSERSSVFTDDDARETARLLDGIASAERDRKALEKTAIKAQEAVDTASREVTRWEQAYKEHVDKLRQKANRG